MSDNRGGGVGNYAGRPGGGGGGVVLAELYEDAFRFAEQAAECEGAGNAEGMRLFLSEAVEAFLHVLDVEEDESRRSLVSQHVGEYISKIERVNVQQQKQQHALEGAAPLRAHAQDVARFALEQALAEDEQQTARRKVRGEEEIDDLIALYMEAADQFLKALRTDTNAGTKEKLTRRLESIISRAEALKTLKIGPDERGAQGARAAAAARAEAGGGGGGAGGDLSKQEKEILVACSRVNGKLFVPFLDDDKRERFVGSVFGDGFVDPDGMLPLAEKQKKQFGGWKRPVELREGRGREPRVVDLISHYSIRQTVISDCSFVASLSVCAVYERMFRQQVITHIIYPQNRKGQPVVSHSGKYLVRLRFNGIDRKIIVDDLLPCSKSGDLLCSYSTNGGELWVSLIEKAYMKLHGGYQFPGSNSGTDLHALVGWIPERASLNEIADRSKQWRRMYDGWKLGQCLLTVSTKEMTEEAADELGLVPSHAYAVLKLVEVEGRRLVQLKNPWAKKRWRGPWGEGDTEHWTPAMQKVLGHNVLKALQVDNGIFWIDFDSLCKYFPDGFLSWNPKMFPYRTSLHSKFERGLPVNDRFCFGDDPQFSVEVRPTDSSGASLWLLLNKHVNTTDEKQRDYVTLHVFDKREGQRVYYTENALISGTYINSPFYLVKLSFGDGGTAKKRGKEPPRRYTIVVSQYERKYDISFTLSAFCTSYFRIVELPQQLRWNYRVESRWNARNAKGCTNYPGYGDNPKFLLRFNSRGRSGGKGAPSIGPNSKTQILVKLDAPDDFYVNLRVYATHAGRESAILDRSLFWVGSGAYRRAFCFVEEYGVSLLQRLPAGSGVAADYSDGEDYRFAEFLIVASTYEPGLVGEFGLTVGSSAANFTLSRL